MLQPYAGRVLRFGIVGSVLTALSYIIFVGLIGAGLHYLIASTAGWAAGIVASYFLNKRFTFQAGGQFDLGQFLTLVAGYVLQLLLASLGYLILIDGLAISPSAAFFINLVFVAAFSFLFMQLVVFPTRISP